MTQNEELSHLIKLVAEFERLDSSILGNLNDLNRFNEILGQTWAIKLEIKGILGVSSPLKIEHALAQKLKKIRDNYGYAIDIVRDWLAKLSGKAISPDEEDIDWMEKAAGEGIFIYIDQDFYRRRNQVGTLIVSESLPEHFVHHFKKLRELFALSLFEPTVIYCRAVIETGCFEALKRRGKVRPDDLRERSLSSLLQSIKEFIYEKNCDNAWKVKKKADDILHSKRKKVLATEEEAFDAIQDTIAIIEELFSGMRRQGRSR